DADGDTPAATLVSGPAHGTLTLHADGSFDYLPNAQFAGDDTFTYQAGDGIALSTAATVTVTVTDAAPVANDDALTAVHDRTLHLAASALLGNDQDADGDALAIVLATGPSHGTAVLNPDGTLDYTPDPAYLGPDSFTYRASDGITLGNAATVSLTVM